MSFSFIDFTLLFNRVVVYDITVLCTSKAAINPFIPTLFLIVAKMSLPKRSGQCDFRFDLFFVLVLVLVLATTK